MYVNRLLTPFPLPFSSPSFSSPYPWATDAAGHARSPRDDLAAARTLIEQCGYWLRKEALEDAEAAARHWPA